MLSLCTPLLLLAAPTASPQFPYGGVEEKFELNGALVNDGLGNGHVGIGDVNGDGFDDFLIAASNREVNGIQTTGIVFVYSGKDQTILYQYAGQAVNDHLGLSYSFAGDVNNDGVNDIFFGSPDIGVGGTAYVYSGANGSLIHEIASSVAGERFARSLAGIGDINADGFDDLLICAQTASPGGLSSAGSAYVYSGKTGTLWSQIDSVLAGGHFGTNCVAIDDIDQDGFPDFMIGAVSQDPNGLTDAGAVYVYSGKTNNLLYQYEGQVLAENLGYTLAGGGDLNGDGVPDFMIGSANAAVGGVSNYGSAFLYSGVNGSLIQKLDGNQPAQGFGSSASIVGDVNGDGADDFTISAHYHDSNSVAVAGVAYLFSGATASIIQKWEGEGSFNYFGLSSPAGDIDNDGLAEFLIGTGLADPGGIFDAGTVKCIGLNPFLTSTSNTIDASNTTLTGFQLRFPAEAGLYQYKVLFSVAGTGPFRFGIDIPLTLDAYALDSYFGRYPFPLTSGMQGTLDANGFGVASIGATPGFLAGAIGATLNFAAIANAPGHLPEFSSVSVPIEVIP